MMICNRFQPFIESQYPIIILIGQKSMKIQNRSESGQKLRSLSHRSKKVGEKIVGNYLIGKKIAHGAYGKVMQAMDLMTRAKVAVKILKIKDQPSNGENSGNSGGELDSQIQNQISIQQSVDHPNIAKIYEVIRQDGHIYIFMEHCPKGELFDYLRSEGPFSQEMAGKVFSQIFSAVKHLHSLGIAHRDIKAENVVFDAKMRPKLIDFGLATKYGISGTKEKLKTFCGSPSYNSPQIVKKKPYDGELADVWSLGVTLYAMLQASLPFDSQNPRSTSFNISSFSWFAPETASEEATELFRSIFVPMKQRPTLEEMEGSAYFKKYCKREDQRRSNSKRFSETKVLRVAAKQSKTIEVKKKSLGFIMENPQVAPSCLKLSRAEILSSEISKKIPEPDFRIRLTPKKMIRKKEGKTSDFLLLPRLIEF